MFFGSMFWKIELIKNIFIINRKNIGVKSNFKDNYKNKKPTEISEIYKTKDSMTDEEFEKFIKQVVYVTFI